MDVYGTFNSNKSYPHGTDNISTITGIPLLTDLFRT